jgi:hypothetical protein
MDFSGKISLALLSIFFAANISSCTVTYTRHHDNGKHKGWFKNPKNPHNPAHKPGNGKPKKNK